MILHFTIPGTPVPMQRVVPFGAKHSKPFTAPKSAKAMRAIAKLGALAMAGRQLYDGPVKLTVEAVFERPPSWPKSHAEAKWHTNTPDAKNIAWCVEDSLKGIVWHDDSQVSVLITFKRYGAPARTIVTIEQLPEQGSYKAPASQAKPQPRLELEISGRPIIGGTRGL